MLSEQIDVEFDVRSDTKGADPDDLRTGSPTLRRYHQLLWSKPADGTNGEPLKWNNDSNSVYLWHDSPSLGRLAVGSDSIAQAHALYDGTADLYQRLTESQREEYQRSATRVGGYIVFPVHPSSMNQRRGSRTGPIRDRFDLTLECIRRHYEEPARHNPLGAVLDVDRQFFALFGDFAGYVDFFHLNDLVDEYGGIRFLLDNFDGEFKPNPLPRDMAEYRHYLERTMEFVEARNRRIERSSPTAESFLSQRQQPQ